MARAWKYLVLLGGIAGVAGFFLPFIAFESTDGMFTGSISAYRLVSGIDDVTQVIESSGPLVAATNADVQAFVKTVNNDLAEYRAGLVAFFLPAVLLALLGALAGARRRMGRLAGLFAIVFGLANAGVWTLFSSVHADEPDKTVSLGLGLHLLLAAGVLGMLAGLGALVLPDRGRLEP